MLYQLRRFAPSPASLEFFVSTCARRYGLPPLHRSLQDLPARSREEDQGAELHLLLTHSSLIHTLLLFLSSVFAQLNPLSRNAGVCCLSFAAWHASSTPHPFYRVSPFSKSFGNEVQRHPLLNKYSWAAVFCNTLLECSHHCSIYFCLIHSCELLEISRNRSNRAHMKHAFPARSSLTPPSPA